MNTEELTQVVTAHQYAISRHDMEMAEIRAVLRSVGERLDSAGERLDSAGERLDSVGERLDSMANRFSSIDECLDRIARQQEATDRQGALNQEAIATLTASIQELRNLVADYLQGRSS